MPHATVVDVAVPVERIDGALSYAVPRALAERCRAGVRVEVPLGKRRVVGLIMNERATDEHGDLKLVAAVLDSAPVVTDEQLAVVRFVSDYYAAGIGEVARLVMPPETARDVPVTYRLTQTGLEAQVFGEARNLAKKDILALARLVADERYTQRGLATRGISSARAQALVVEGLLLAEDTRAIGATPHEMHVRPLDDGGLLPARAPALAAIDAWLRVHGTTPLVDLDATFPGARGKVRRLAQLGRVALDERSKHIVHESGLSAGARPERLTEPQRTAVDAITRAIHAAEAHAFLLEGVTGSGKTEVYLHALQVAVARGKGALLLVPEIALTPQLLSRVRQAVGTDVVALHSAVPAGERRSALSRLMAGEVRVVVGARSALFAPVRDLGLVVVDEEHDPSLKQDESPRYHARDVALWRARAEGAVCVLGSATPSLESRANVAHKKLEHLVLPARATENPLPRIEVVDLRARQTQKTARSVDRPLSEGPGVVLSRPLVTALEEVLARGEQALLFLNRRGYAAAALCEECGAMTTCPQCSVSLTVHKSRRALVCHQCDHTEPWTPSCPACGAEARIALGLGTERVEAEVRARFPEARVRRLDRDVARRRVDVEATLVAMQRREIDVLIGTQMVAKGHDFPAITLVGIVLADVALALPDFRASERAFSQLTQVAGRAGRGDQPGRVLLQTYDPTHPAIAAALEHDVRGFATRELAEREELHDPPFTRALLVRVEGEDELAVAALAELAAARLRATAKALHAPEWAVRGPAEAPFARLRGKTRHHMFVRARTHAERVRFLHAVAHDDEIARRSRQTGCRVVLDVDPVHVL